MSKILKSTIITVLFLFICMATSFASIPRSDMVIGGITMGSSLDYVEQVYGLPNKSYYGEGDWITGESLIYEYVNGNNLFKVVAGTKGNFNRIVYSITCREKGLSTPSGLSVGMNFSEVKKLYGKGSAIKKDMAVSPIDKCSYYEYNSGSNIMQFAVDSDGIIRQIVIFN
ncbi:hypothetical protein B5F82_02735 [Megamonas hypermegale]|uniref:hypothetical protein n=1 Tax=Megamonas hypermegale TaxID=158847 RepID=UPI000B39310C|nr:hypothetical protein [Megamonas hypermegale]OUO40974.1 hypothetical protein B5F82_02735 [Megamonas hypermegale]